MTLKGKNRLVIHDILVGDVWLASGQSNMEFPMQVGPDRWMTGVENHEEEIGAANFPGIRLLHVHRDDALTSKSDVASPGWERTTPESVGSFSAVAFLFGRGLHDRYQVPVGLIESSWGGTVAEAWMSESSLRRFGSFDANLDAIAHVGEADQAAYHNWLQQRVDWHLKHDSDDRGCVYGRPIWAESNLNVESWDAIALPRPDSAWGMDFDGFDGVIWLRKTINLASEQLGKELTLHFGYAVRDDVTWFNGEKVGETLGPRSRRYIVPPALVRPGPNTIAIRLVGIHDPEDPDGCGVGIYGPMDAFWAQVGETRIPLSGAWQFKSGPDLRSWPAISSAAAEARPFRNAPSELFNGMISPLLPFAIKGVIWYQGESNAERSSQYRTLFPALINDWRRGWGYTFPFLFVQLAGFGPDLPESSVCQWAELREAQEMALALPCTGMASAIDLGDANQIHPRNKQDVARRLVLVAAKTAYGEKLVAEGPRLKSISIEGERVRVQWSDLGGGLEVKDRYGYVRGFEVAASDGNYLWAEAHQDGQDILVSNPSVKRPVSVRYNWSNTPDGNVYNREGFPALPFRTGQTAP